MQQCSGHVPITPNKHVSFLDCSFLFVIALFMGAPAVIDIDLANVHMSEVKTVQHFLGVQKGPLVYVSIQMFAKEKVTMFIT